MTTVSMTPDNQWILVGGRKFLWLLDFQSGKYQRRYRGHRDDITAVMVTPDGDALISASNDNDLTSVETSSPASVCGYLQGTVKA